MLFKEELLSLELASMDNLLEREVVLPTGINAGTSTKSRAWNMKENSSSAFLLLCGLGVAFFMFS
jgi:hypothetical protein